MTAPRDDGERTAVTASAAAPTAAPAADDARGARTAPGVRVDGVALARDGHEVFRELSLTLAGGEWHALLGRSGVGKSSLLRLLAGLDRPDRGRVGDDAGGSLARRTAYLPQDDGLLPWLDARANVQLGPHLRGRVDAATRARADALLARVGLERWRSARPGALSGGMRQRVALARTLLEDRAVVLMDEPFSRLDAITRDELQALACGLLAGRTVVLVTHDPAEALRLARTVTVLHPGLPTRTTTLRLPGVPPRAPDDPATMARLRTLWTALADEPARATSGSVIA